MVGKDIESYRVDRSIKEKPEDKHRCWRINYRDGLGFHIDIVPAIPEVEYKRIEIQVRMVNSGTDSILASDVAKHLVSITDNRHPQYEVITPNWHISNQEGYALWFESRMRQARLFLERSVAKVDLLRPYRWKTPLQRCIQILKRHRDIMFENDPVNKPISVIITTLAAWSYTGESDVESAMATIIQNMESFVNASIPKIPNPVNQQEDFADKWINNPKLETCFWTWLGQLKSDYATLEQCTDVKRLAETVQSRFGATIDESQIIKIGTLLPKAAAITTGVARTTVDGTIGTIGVANRPHKFYGEI